MLSLPRRSCARRPRRTTLLSPPEALDVRLMPAVAGIAGVSIPPVRPMIEVQAAPAAAPAGPIAARPQAWSESGPWGLNPQQVAAAYGFDGIAFSGVAGDGAGQTIAIVDAYDNPALVNSSDPSFAASDLAQFDRQYGLPDPPSFVKVGQQGGTRGLPGRDPAGAGIPGNWEEEEALDVEWAHALAPAASIVLVECDSAGGPDLYAGARTAAAWPGVTVVSMSWGSAEYSGEDGFDGTFTTPAGHPGVTFVAATGDAGAPGLYPAYSPNVLAVGGTDLTIRGGDYGDESGWSNGGGGTSITEAQPAYQSGVQATGRRTIPDVALDADPTSGASVYDSFDDTTGSGPWMKTAGTSLATPIWAALIAIADQGRVAAGGSPLDGASRVLPALYALPASDFHDVTTGGNGVFEAGPGYDQSTGRGTPIASMVAPALAYDDLAPWLAIDSGPPSVVAAGQPFALTVEVENPDGSLDANFVGSVTIRLGAGPGGAALGGTLTAPAIGGYATFAGLTLTQAGAGYTILAASPEGPASARTAPFEVAAAAPAEIVVVGAATGRHKAIALTVAVVDAYGNVVDSYNGGVTLLSGPHARSQATSRHGRPAGTVAMAVGGVATFSHLQPAPASRRHILQAQPEEVLADAILTPAEPAPAGKGSKHKKPK